MHRSIAAFVAAHLGAPVEAWRFVSTRRATTCGVRLADGREVVVKVHPRGGPDAERLRAVQSVQRHLAGGGFPCPEPLLDPVPLGDGLATVETLVDGGRPPDPSSAADRRAMARILAAIVRCSRPLHDLRALDAAALRELPDGVLWPPPPDGLRLADDDAETRRIDAVGAAARRLRLRTYDGIPVVGHGDWHVEHVRLAGARAVAVYDWDALVRASEPFLVGCAVGGFTADWTADRPPLVPRHEEAVAFVADYEAARGTPFTHAERAAVLGHWLEMTAYAARVEHARGSGRRYREALDAHADAVLADA